MEKLSAISDQKIFTMLAYKLVSFFHKMDHVLDAMSRFS